MNPAVIAPEDFDSWLDVQNTPLKEARALLRPAPESLFETLPVSTRVNSASEDAPDLVEPVAAPLGVIRDEAAAEPAPPKAKRQAAKGRKSSDDQFDLF